MALLAFWMLSRVGAAKAGAAAGRAFATGVRRSRRRSRTTAAAHAAHAAGAHDDRLVEQAAGERGLDQGADGAAAGALAEDHHVVRIAAELGDVLLDPLQALDHVQDTVVAGHAVRAFGRQLGMGQEAEDAEAVVDGHEHHAVVGELLTVELGLGAPAFAVAAAMNPVRDREFLAGLAGGRRPDVQVQAVFTALRFLAIAPFGEIAAGIVDGLVAGMAEAVGLHHAVPRNDGLRFLPAEVANRRRGVRDAFVRDDTRDVGRHALDLTTFDGQHRDLCFRLARGKQQGRKGQEIEFLHITEVWFCVK